jgi:DNA-binding transcriptional ArsR family regulator
MDVEYAESPVSGIAAAIAEPARTRMLYALLDGRARTSTELAIVAEVSPSTASVHLARLRERRLLKMHAQGRHRYYSLADAQVAAALEALSVLAGQRSDRFEPNTPHRLRAARTCYDHMAGALAVALHDRLFALRWLKRERGDEIAYEVTAAGAEGLAALGIDVGAARSARRRFACACLDWSERRPHLAGAIGAELLNAALRRKWVTRDLDSRALNVTHAGRREMRARFGAEV